MNRSEILTTAEQYVSADRNDQYGEPEDNFSLIAEYWSVYLGDRDGILDAFDVSVMMALLKVARLSKRPVSPDSAVDLAGYAACAGEILENTRRVSEAEREQVVDTLGRDLHYHRASPDPYQVPRYGPGPSAKTEKSSAF